MLKTLAPGFLHSAKRTVVYVKVCTWFSCCSPVFKMWPSLPSEYQKMPLLICRTDSFLWCPQEHFAFLMQSSSQGIHPASRGALGNRHGKRQEVLMHCKKDLLSQKTLEADDSEREKKQHQPKKKKKERILMKKQPTNQSVPQLQWGKKLQMCTRQSHLYIQQRKMLKKAVAAEQLKSLQLRQAKNDHETLEPPQPLSLPRSHFLFFVTLIFSKDQLLLVVIQLLWDSCFSSLWQNLFAELKKVLHLILFRSLKGAHHLIISHPGKQHWHHFMPPAVQRTAQSLPHSTEEGLLCVSPAGQADTPQLLEAVQCHTVQVTATEDLPT